MKTTLAGAEGGENRAKSSTHIDIVERNEDRVGIRLREHHEFPSLPLDIEISLLGRCKVDPNVADEEISAAVRSGGYPLFARRSQIVGFASEACIGVPIILPPCAEGSSKESQEKP